MAWYQWLILAIVLGGTFWVWRTLMGSGVMHCVGCGQCAVTGRCVLRRKSGGKPGETDRKPS